MYETTYHWIIFLKPVFTFLVLTTLGILLSIVIDKGNNGLHWVALLNLLWLFILLPPYVKRKTDEFAITNKRVIVKIGWLSRRTLEMSLLKIETVGVDQTIFGRIFGFGTIKIIGTGGTHEVFPFIRNPLEFRKKFQEVSMP